MATPTTVHPLIQSFDEGGWMGGVVRTMTKKSGCGRFSRTDCGTMHGFCSSRRRKRFPKWFGSSSKDGSPSDRDPGTAPGSMPPSIMFDFTRVDGARGPMNSKPRTVGARGRVAILRSQELPLGRRLQRLPRHQHVSTRRSQRLGGPCVTMPRRPRRFVVARLTRGHERLCCEIVGDVSSVASWALRVDQR